MKTIVLTEVIKGRFYNFQKAEKHAEESLRIKIEEWKEKNDKFEVVSTDKIVTRSNEYMFGYYKAEAVVSMLIQEKAESEYEKLISQYGNKVVMDQVIFTYQNAIRHS